MQVSSRLAAFVTLLVACTLLSGGDGVAQEQDRSQRACISPIAASGANVSKAQGREINRCVKDFTKNRLLQGETAQICFTADHRGKVAKAVGKTERTELSRCGFCSEESANASTPCVDDLDCPGGRCKGEFPDFGYTSADETNNAAIEEQFALSRNVLGLVADDALFSETESLGQARCQVFVVKRYEKVLEAKLKVWTKCLKDGLRSQAGVSPAIQTLDELRDLCQSAVIDDSLNFDAGKPKGRVARAVAKLEKSAEAQCIQRGVDLPPTFPGLCDATNDSQSFSLCIDTLVECRFCHLINRIAGLDIDCDLFDDGVVNQTCGPATCGDGILEPSEECEPTNDAACPGSCAGNCTCTNLPPVADAGPDRQAVAGAILQVIGSTSFDPDGDPINFSWALVSSPAGSAPLLSDAGSPVVGLLADLPGDYTLRLSVSDALASDTDDMIVGAIDPAIGPDGDGDGLSDDAEGILGTDPNLADSDSDGLDDGEEALQTHTDPLDQDTDGDGFSDGDENAVGSDPLDSTVTPLGVLTQVEESSPANGETGVAVTRETIIRLSKPLAGSTSVGSTDVFAEFGGQQLSVRIHLSTDRKTVTLFYDNPLPASARVRVTIVGDLLVDEAAFALDADGDGIPGGTRLVDFDTLSLTVVPGTSVCGRVFASELVPGDSGMSVNVPLEGVTITVDGQESALFAVTDSMGDFCLDPAPAGRFFVHVDGRTATNGVPAGAYYPFVGKPWESVPGQQVNVGDVFLPLVAAGTLQPVNAVSETVIGFPQSVLDDFPEFADVKITVPADSLFADDGSRGGMVGMAPVPPDRLPGQLPPELNFSIVITVQTDGATNFDVPVPVCFPNLPDLITGEVLAAGEPSALWSFNHDTGGWQIVGPMTVTADGKSVCTDLGVGITAPGWHGQQPGAQAKADPPRDGQKNQCRDGILKETALCALSLVNFSAGASCTLGTATAFGGMFGACAARTGRPDCVRGIGNFFGGTLTSCAKLAGKTIFKPISTAWDVYSCSLSVGGVLSTECFSSSRASLGVAARANLIDDADLLTAAQGLAREGERLRRIADAATAIFGDPIWFSGELGEGAVFADWILNFVIAVDEFGDAGQKISGSEFTLLSTDSVPTQLSVADIAAFVDRWNRTIDYWDVGIFDVGDVPPGQSLDFVALDSVLPLMQDAQLAAAGSLLDGFSDLYDGVEHYTARVQDRVVQLSGGSERREPFYYAVVPEDGGLILRGRTTGQGFLPTLRLSPESVFKIWWLSAVDLKIAAAGFATGTPGSQVTIPRSQLFGDPGPDTDSDGLPDLAEVVVGTDENDPDSDDDGVTDGAEVLQGTDPLDGVAVVTGVVTSADTPGNAIDVCAVNDTAIVADSDAGVAVFNVFNGMDPTIIAQVDTPGSAQAVACAGDLVPVADGTSGLAIIDISDPPAASIVHQVSLGSTAQAVAQAAGVAYVGVKSGTVFAVDLATGTILDILALGAEVEDLTVGADYLYVSTVGTLHTVDLTSGALDLIDSVASPGPGPNGATRRLRVFAGTSVLYETHPEGYNTFDLSDPEHPTLITQGTSGQFSWNQIVPNGSGLGLAARGRTSNPVAPREVSLYDVSDPTKTDEFLTEFQTPGLASAIAIFNGLAYVADGDAGLQVVNYLPYDALGVPPTIQLETNAVAGVIEEGRRFRMTALVGDDVQVRNVTFIVDGVEVSTDGGFPFEHRFAAPQIADQTSFTIQARAVDTGGNTAETAEITIALIPDATPPEVVAVSPPDGGFRGNVGVVTTSFSELIDPSTLGGAFTLSEAGTDGALGTADDVPVAVSTVEFRDELRTAFFDLQTALAPGLYGATVDSAVADLAGNPLSSSLSWAFTVFEVGGDSDGDCLPDTVETALGLDPADPDSDGDGLLDGEEDTDGDGLLNCPEVLSGLDPGNGDTDRDGLSDSTELAIGTNPLAADTDGDGFLDGEEVEFGADPNDPSSTPAVVGVTIGIATAPVVSVLNQRDPTVPLATQHADGRVVSVLNQRDPTVPLATQHADGRVVSVLNQGDPTQLLNPQLVDGAIVSVENLGTP